MRESWMAIVAVAAPDEIEANTAVQDVAYEIALDGAVNPAGRVPGFDAPV